MTKYYRKELPDTPVYIDGRPFKFDILQTSDPYLIAELDKCIARQVGGVIALTAAEYAVEAQKKTMVNGSESRLTLSSVFSQRQSQRPELSFQSGRHAAAIVNRDRRPEPGTLPTSGRPIPPPIQVPTGNSFSGIFLKPATARASEVAAATAPIPPTEPK